jgi:hypothetical protein
MTSSQISRDRLHHQHLTGSKFKTPAEVVRWFGAVQAQDYLGSLWAMGLRMQNASEKAIEQAVAARTIVRTWPMRQTLHFIAAADVRWMLKLLTPRMISRILALQLQLELDERVLGRRREVFVNALGGGKQLSRVALYEQLESNGIATGNMRGRHILCHLAQEGLICFGGREGKQQTFVLLDEWLSPTRLPERDEALAELAKRYFVSHGPATLQDFIWWSGLTVADANAGIEMSKAHLKRKLIGGKTYWMASSTGRVKTEGPPAYLLPAFDEYTVAYKDRSAILTRLTAKSRRNIGMGVLGPVIVVDGQVVGTWKRTLEKSSITVRPTLFVALNKAQKQALRAAVSRYGAFLEQPAKLV